MTEAIGRIIHSHDCIAEGAAYLADLDPRFRIALETCGPPPLRLRKDGFAALLDAIVSQQVSVAAADAIWNRMKAAGLTGPRKIMWASDDDLRAVGLSRQKIRYARALAEARLLGSCAQLRRPCPCAQRRRPGGATRARGLACRLVG